MKQVVIENPVINSPFDEPNRQVGGRGASPDELHDEVVKVSTARTLWVPAINNHGSFGRWAFIEITDPWNAKNELKSFPHRPNGTIS